MGATGRRTIVVKSDAFRKERKTGEADIYPGHLVDIDTSGNLVKHASAGQACLFRLAIENDVEGGAITDVYASGDRAQYMSFHKGDEVLVRIKNGENIAIADELVSAGNGTFKEHTPDSASTDEEVVLCQALEACDMSDSSGGDADGWCLVEVV